MSDPKVNATTAQPVEQPAVATDECNPDNPLSFLNEDSTAAVASFGDCFTYIDPLDDGGDFYPEDGANMFRFKSLGSDRYYEVTRTENEDGTYNVFVETFNAETDKSEGYSIFNQGQFMEMGGILIVADEYGIWFSRHDEYDAEVPDRSVFEL